MKKQASLSHHQHRAIDKDYMKAAMAASLKYVTDSQQGIERHKRGTGFYYTYLNKKVSDKNVLARIRSLVIPPAWKNVWICWDPQGHIQATGIDKNGRKQYRYHPDWHTLRNETKFHRMYEFGQVLPKIRRRLRKDISTEGVNEQKVLATVVLLMEQTYIRIGNNGYEKLYGSYGLTTLKDSHVKLGQEKLQFSFTGKKGIAHSITIKNKKLARLVKQCRDIPGKTLFQYYSREGERKSIDSGMVNNYIKEVSGGDFSAKDFRTWAGTVKALECFRSLCKEEDCSDTQVKKNIVFVLDQVSRELGNTRTVCKKYYVHPGLVQLYENRQLLDCLNKTTTGAAPAGLCRDEKDLLFILRKCMRPAA